jgi:GNAT superfamily N-acetyltransferase
MSRRSTGRSIGGLLVADRYSAALATRPVAGEGQSAYGGTQLTLVAGARVATPADASGIANTFALAFQDDPLWAWAFPDPARRYELLTIWWRLFIDGALRYPWTWITPNYEAAAVWIPPGCTELSSEAEADVEPLLHRLLGDGSQRVLEILAEFDQAHPAHLPHYYLSILGTHPDHRGHGLAMGLVADNLENIDRQHAPAYLESSNPMNHARYARAGFVHIGEFAAPGGPPVATMWREAR